MTGIAPMDWQLARGRALNRAQHPTWREAATFGITVAVLISVMMLWFPTRSLGPTEPEIPVSASRIIRVFFSNVAAGVLIASVGSFIVRAIRRQLVAIRYRDPVT